MLEDKKKKKLERISLKLAYYNIFNFKYFQEFFIPRIKKESSLYKQQLLIKYKNNITKLKSQNNKINYHLFRTLQSYYYRYLMQRGGVTKALNLVIDINLNIKKRTKNNIYIIYNGVVMKFQPFIGGKPRVKSGNKFEVPYILPKKKNENNVIKTLIKKSREYTEQSRIITIENEIINSYASALYGSGILQKNLAEANLLLKNSRSNIKQK